MTPLPYRLAEGACCREAVGVLRSVTEPARLCEDCPPKDYPTDKTRCLPCPRRLFSEHAVAVASSETERLTRELDITNADHIVLWLEANMADSSLGWLACRIVEAHEKASDPTERIARRMGCTFVRRDSRP